MTADQLKNSILQMAVQGKLVPQDPNDEPASVLLERIRAEKEQLIKEDKIKKEKNNSYIFRGSDGLFYEKIGNNEPVCIEDEVPFDIPESWEWDRLGNITDYDGKKQKINSKDADLNLWQLDLEDIEKGGNILRKCSVYEKKSAGDKTVFHKGEVLYSKLRPYLLKVLVAPDDGICTSEIVPFSIYGDILAEYLVCYLKSPSVDFYINSITYGIKMPRVGTQTMVHLLVPIPPTNEQIRILNMIQRLQPYLEKYNEDQIASSVLDEEFPDQLKKSVLQQAVQGKLVPQNSNDEPASVMLEKIHAEKEQLIREGKIKRDKHESVIYRRDGAYYEKVDGKEHCIDDEIPFEIPYNWAWIRLGNYAEKITDQVASGSFASIRANVPSLKEPDYAVMVKTADFGNDFSHNLTYTTKHGYDFLNNSNLFGGELILSNIGSIGKCFIVPKLDQKMTLAPNAVMIRLINEELRDYLYYFILSPQGYLELIQITSGTAMKKFNKTDLKTILIPVPPLKEQHRIVDKINSILPYIDSL